MKSINMLILFSLFMLAFAGEAYSQYSIPLRLVNSDGTPNTGEAANISFTRYPHSHPTDVVSGITITEIGTAGNYRCRGFTTYEYVKLWLSGVEQTWFDSVQVGSITSYLSSNYISKTTTQTGISGTKTLTGTWTFTSGTQTFNTPYIYGSSSWVSDYSLGSSTSLVWRAYADSVYGIKPWYYDGSNIRLNSGLSLLGRTSTTSPLGINSYHFTWSGDALQLNWDNALSDSLRVRKDTIISENTYSKYWVLKRRFWSQQDSLNLFWHYRNSYTNTTDSFRVINNIVSTDNETSVSLQYDGTAAKIDSVYLYPGTYMISFGLMWERPDHNDENQMDIADTVVLALKEADTAPNTYVINNIRDIHTYADTTNFEGGELSWSTALTVYTGKYVYLYGKYFATSLTNAIGVGATASVKRGRIIATLIR